MVFNVGTEDKKIKVKDKNTKQTFELTQKQHFQNTTSLVVNALEKAGLKTDLFYSVQKDEIYVRIGATEERLMREADRIDYDLQLDSTKCLEMGAGLNIRLAKKTMDNADNAVTPQSWLNIFGKYDQFDAEHPWRQELYMRYNTQDEKHPRFNSVFNSTDRLKLTVSIIEADSKLGGAEISVYKLTHRPNHSLITMFPLHEPHVLDGLAVKWRRWAATWKSPIQDIRDYFGEAVALYFAFLGYYNRSLVGPAFIGLIFFIWQMADGRMDVEGIPAYAIFVSLWATLFLEFWKRREAKYRIRWGMSTFVQKEQPRPEFHGDWKTSPVDGRLVEIFPWTKKIIRAIMSQTVIWTLIFVVIASVVGVFFFRDAVSSYSWGTYVTAIVNAVQIAILNYVYQWVSVYLNGFENHRTDSDYENALIAKTFLFKFVNSYNTLFYIAFIKRFDENVGGCINDNCSAELQQQMGTIFIANIVISNTVEVLIPAAMAWWTERQNRAVDTTNSASSADKPVFKDLTQCEKEFFLAPYEGTFSDFDELVIQFGYVTLFVVAFPLAPLAALINNVIETRVDSTKLLKLSRRPEPRGAASIGTWYDVLNIVSVIAVATNAGLICFETDLINDAVSRDAIKVYIFVIAEHLVLLLKFAIGYFVPDVPEELVTHLARQDYIVNVLIKGMEDEPDEEMDKKSDETTGTVENPDFDWSRVKDTLVPDPAHEFLGYERLSQLQQEKSFI